jgi:CheY-like chemotaxis protein
MNRTGNQQSAILIVEDIEEIRSGMKRSLLSCGYRVMEAADAAGAVEVASCWPPDLILTEEELPTFTLLMKSAREHSSLKGRPVMIINPDVEDGTRYVDAITLTDYDQLTRFLPNAEKASDQEQ